MRLTLLAVARAPIQDDGIRHCPVQLDQSQQTFHTLGRLPKWHRKYGLASGKPEWRFHCIIVADCACRSEGASKPSRDQTRSTTIRTASSYHCKPTNSWSCTSSGPTCACSPDIMLDSYSETLKLICVTKPVQRFNRDRHGLPTISIPALIFGYV